MNGIWVLSLGAVGASKENARFKLQTRPAVSPTD